MSLRKYIKQVSCVSSRTSVLDASREMSTKNIGAVVVVSDDGKPIGMLTDRDVVLRVVCEGKDPVRTPVGDVMTHGTAFLSHDASIREATEVMRDCGMRRLLLVDKEGRLDGLVSLDDIVLLLGMELGNLAGALFQNLSARIPPTATEASAPQP
jgi:CBS domain-containing protein